MGRNYRRTAASALLLAGPLAVTGFAGSAQAAGTIWYVAPHGAHAAPCGATRAHPCATVALAVAQAAAGDTISIAAGRYPAATAADLTVLDKNLTLAGSGQGRTVLDGKRFGTVVTVDAGVTALIRDLAVEGGSGTSTTVAGNPAIVGGGILNEGTLTLDRVTVRGNHVSATGAGAGSVNAYGGGIFNADGGALTVTRSLIAANSASVTDAGSGGGEAVGGGITSDATFLSPTSDTSVSFSRIAGNSVIAHGSGTSAVAAGGGGAGELYSVGHPALSFTVVSGNKASATGSAGAAAVAAGGGVYQVGSGTADGAVGLAILGNRASALASGTQGAGALGAGLAEATSNGAHALADSVARGNTTTATATGGGLAEAQAGGIGLLVATSQDAATHLLVAGNAVSARSTAAGAAVSLGGGVLGAASSSAAGISDSVIRGNRSVAVNDGTANAGAGGAGIGGLTSPLTDSLVTGNVTRASASGTPAVGSVVQVNVIGGAVSAALNADTTTPVAPEIDASTLARNTASAIYSGTGAGIAQSVGGAVGAVSSIANSTVAANRATAVGSGTGVSVLTPLASQRIGPAGVRRAGLAGLTGLLKAQAQAELARLAPVHAARRAAPAAGTLTSALVNGGGIGGLGGVAANSTISGDVGSATSTGAGVATAAGGGIDSANTPGATLTNVTIAGNRVAVTGPTGSSATGGGVGSSASMANTVVAGNTPTDCGAPTGTDLGGNLDTDGTCGLSAAHGSVSAGTADLGPLRYNGGPTPTRALRAGSQAIGLGLASVCEQVAGPNGVLDTDQRGMARNSVARGVCDSGAYDTGGTRP